MSAVVSSGDRPLLNSSFVGFKTSLLKVQLSELLCLIGNIITQPCTKSNVKVAFEVEKYFLQQEIVGVQNKTCAGSVLLFVCFFVTIVTTSIFCTSTHKPVKNICIFSGTNRPQTCVRCGLKIMKTMFRNHQKSIFLKKFLCG